MILPEKITVENCKAALLRIRDNETNMDGMEERAAAWKVINQFVSQNKGARKPLGKSGIEDAIFFIQSLIDYKKNNKRNGTKRVSAKIKQNKARNRG